MSSPLVTLSSTSGLEDYTRPTVKQQVVASPISDLPFDILLAIFETLVCPWDANQMMPILLSRVCTRWRDCVVNSPTLWSTIRTIEVLDLTTKFLVHEIKRVKMFLRRSKECPLTIDMAIYSRIDEIEDDALADNLPEFHDTLQDLSRTLGQHAHRIKSFKLSIDENQSMISILSGLTAMPMPMLTHWNVQNPYDDSWNLDDEAVNAHSILLYPSETSEGRISLYPNLRSVILHAIPQHWSRFSPSNLVTLEIKILPEIWRPSAHVLASILRTNAHSLEKLILFAALPAPNYLGEVITLPKLEWIELGFIYTSEAIPLINAIEVPNLRALGLCDGRREYLHPARRRNDPGFDTGIVNLFAVIVNRFPLSQITDMTLRHIALCPMPAPSAEILSNRMDIAIDFFCRLENLNYLVISNSDTVTLDALNRVQVLGTKRPKFPVPKLAFLEIKDTGYQILQHFVWHRLGGRSGYLDALVINMPDSWYKVSKWDRINTEKLAQEVIPLVSRVDEIEEQQLAVT